MHMQTTHKPKRPSWLQSIRHWLSHPAFEVLPPIFGNVVPSESSHRQAISLGRVLVVPVPIMTDEHIEGRLLREDVTSYSQYLQDVV
jgi:hypothetical protein